MQKIVVMDHPLIQHKVGLIRKKETGSKEFRELIGEIAMYMCYEATRDLKLTDIEIETPICRTTVKELSGKKLAVVPILRAGLGMVEGMLAMIPAAKVGHIGLYRDPETLKPVEYYCKLPADSNEREVFVVDPMLATGGSAVAAIQMLKDKGVKNIRFLCIIAAPEGVEAGRRLIRMSIFISERWISISMSTDTLFRVLVMPETVFSEPNKKAGQYKGAPARECDSPFSRYYGRKRFLSDLVCLMLLCRTYQYFFGLAKENGVFGRTELAVVLISSLAGQRRASAFPMDSAASVEPCQIGSLVLR